MGRQHEIDRQLQEALAPFQSTSAQMAEEKDIVRKGILADTREREEAHGPQREAEVAGQLAAEAEKKSAEAAIAAEWAAAEQAAAEAQRELDAESAAASREREEAASAFQQLMDGTDALVEAAFEARPDPEVRPETSIWATSCCCNPLTGVRCVRLGPRRSCGGRRRPRRTRRRRW